MKISPLPFVIAVLSVLLFTGCTKTDGPLYRQASAPVEQRVNDLLARMTLSEKVHQLIQYSSQDLWDKSDSLITLNAQEKLGEGIGMLEPPELSLPPARVARRLNAAQKYLVEKTRLGIPALVYGEALHGYVGSDATSFPNPLSLGCTWDTALVRQIYTVAALEMKSRGVNQALSPVLGLGREPRWGRTEETFGEDPYHVSRIGLAAIQGLQGNGPDGIIPENHVVATAKHFAVHSQPEGGRNTAPGNYSERVIRDNFLVPFETAVKEGQVRCLMASYNEIDGIPSHANKALLTGILVDEWKHTGYVISDLGGIEDLYRYHRVARDSAEAGRLAIEAGVDMDLNHNGQCFTSLTDQVKKGMVDEKVIDDAVKRILRVKFESGLFEHPYADPLKAEQNARNPAHSALAMKAGEESVVLLKNADHLLPLDPTKIRSLAVIGPDAGDIHLGGYSMEPRFGVSILEGLKDYAGSRFNVKFAEGCRIMQGTASFWDDGNPVPNPYSDDEKLMNEAVKVAASSDVVLMVLGGNESTCREAWSESHLGDRESLDLPGRQNELFEKVLGTGKPVAVLILGGRPLAVNEIAQKANALFEGFYMGQESGKAFARILFGEVNPSGKLAITIPRSVGQLPMYYNRKPSRMRGYLWQEQGPLYPFGFGLSYTTFTYTGLSLSDTIMNPSGNITAKITVSNTGMVKGDEIIQMYIRDEFSSVTRPVLELKDFARITLDPGESKEVSFNLSPEKLWFYNIDMKRVVEPGKFRVFIGPDSQHLQETEFTVVE